MPTIAIVGAGSGMGLAVARTFGGRGFGVALVSRNKEKLDDLVATLAGLGIDAAGFSADVMDRPTIAEAFGRVKERFGAVDVLEYSPAPHGPVPGIESVSALEVTVENIQPQIEFYLYGAMVATAQVLPDMLAAGRGTLLFTSGGSSVNARAWLSNVGIGGAALRSWANSLRLAVAPSGVYVAHVPIGVRIGEAGSDTDADTISAAYWDLYANGDRASRSYSWWDRDPDEGGGEAAAPLPSAAGPAGRV
jgi:NAD(P)-dependent dehydrogenase (short-subunit alcohol dehydrogenase family)